MLERAHSLRKLPQSLRAKLDPRDPHGERKEPTLVGCSLTFMCTRWRAHTQTHVCAKSVSGISFKTHSFFCVVELGIKTRALKSLSKYSTEPHPQGTLPHPCNLRTVQVEQVFSFTSCSPSGVRGEHHHTHFRANVFIALRTQAA